MTSECCRCLSALMLYINILSICLLAAMSGSGYSYFEQDYFFSSCTINHKVFYGCLIGVSILLFIGSLICYALVYGLFFLMPIFIVVVCLIITYSTPNELNKCIQNHESKWYDSSVNTLEYQIHYRCCGWHNSSDHGLEICPPTFNSGCLHTLEDYLSPRLERLLISGCLILCLSVISFVFIVSSTICEGEEALYDMLP